MEDTLITSSSFWADCLGTTPPRLIEAYEKELKIKLPLGFKRLINSCNGGTPKNNIFNYYSVVFNRYEQSSVGVFLFFSDEESTPCERFSDYYSGQQIVNIKPHRQLPF